MPYAENNGVKIFYKEEGNGPPIVLHHGLGGTHENWSRTVDYVGALRDEYRIVSMDARGRGRSDKPHAPEEHSVERMVGDVTAVLDDFWGSSMGGRVGLATGKYAPDRFSSHIVGGNGLSEKDSKPEMEELQGYIRMFEQGVDAVIALMEKGRGSKLEDYERDKWLNADLQALIAYCSNYENIGMADYLPKLTTPCLLYAGAEDTYPHSRAKACADIMQNATFVSLPGLDHGGAFRAKDQVLPHVLRFLEGLQ